MAADDETPAAVARAAARLDAWLTALRADLDTPPQELTVEPGSTPDLLEGARRDAGGFAFTRTLIEALIAENDPFSAALGLRAAAQDLPPSLPARDRLAVRVGGLASLGLPRAVLPVVRRWLRERVSHLVLASKMPGERGGCPAPLHAALDANRAAGCDTMLALGGRAVLGPEGAARELDRLIRLTRLPEVGHLAVDPARLVPEAATGTGYWALDADAGRGAAILRTLFEEADAHETGITLEANDYRAALLGPEMLVRALDGAGGLGAAGIGVSLPAELPESAAVIERLIRLSRARVDDGGAPLELTIGVAGLASRASIASLLSGLAVPTLEGRDAVRAQFLRLAGAALAAGSAVRTVFATEDPLLLAHLTLLAEDAANAGTAPPQPPVLQLRAGVATPLATSLADHGFPVRLRLPIVLPREFSGAIAGLLGLAAESADPESTLARTPAAAEDAAAADLAEAIRLATQPWPPAHRTQLRRREWDPGERDSALFYRPPADAERFDTGGLTAAVLGLGRDDTGQIAVGPSGPPQRIPVVSEVGFACEPDTDATKPQNREWARSVFARSAQLREEGSAHERRRRRAKSGSAGEAEGLAEAWRTQRAAERATRVGRLALATASARDRLLTVLAAERGLPVAALDAEVSRAVEAARYFGLLAGGLGAVRGAAFSADRLVLVAADAQASFSERAEAVLAALAAGSAVVLVEHPGAARSSAALIEEWEAAGLPEGLVELVCALPSSLRDDGDRAAGGDAAEPEASDSAASDPAPSDPVISDPATAQAELAALLAVDRQVDRAIVLGDRSIVRSITRHRPDLPVEGRLRTLGSTLIAPSADPAAAVRDAVRSAFGGAVEARAARVLVLLGGAGHAKRVLRLLADAVRGLRIGDTGAGSAAGGDPLAIDFGPLPAAPDAAGLRALTELDPGEEWLIEPQQLDEAGLLWRPGVRTGLRRDARFWQDAIGMPVIGVITAADLTDAIDLQNALGGGSVAALHAVDRGETLPWLDGVRAASLSIGRATSDARVERQPGGGWGAASLGGQPLAGGPNRLFALGSWELREGTPSSTLHLRGLDPRVQALIETSQASLDYASFDRLRRAALSDALTWRTSLGRVRDEIGLGVERNVLRHWPIPTHVRLADGGSIAELLRVLAAGLLVDAPLSVSTGVVVPPEITELLENQGVPVSLEHDEGWLERLAVLGVERAGADTVGGDRGSERVRLIGGDAVRTAEWLGGQDRLPLRAEPVTMAGPVELLVFLREQAITIAAHRHGFAAPLAGVDERLAELDAAAARPRQS